MTTKEIIEKIKKDSEMRDRLCGADYDFDDDEIFELVDDDDWSQEHKNQYRCSVYKHIESDTYFQLSESRSGSYHTDWYYDMPEITLVKRVEKVVTRTEVTWVPIE